MPPSPPARSPIPRPRALLGGLPIEVLSPLRDMALPPETAVTALLAAHMMIFWLSQDSNVTPPVCLAAFTAAAIAKAPAMRTGLASWKVAKGLYAIPLLFAYTPLLSGDAARRCRCSASPSSASTGWRRGCRAGWTPASGPPP
jgi:TRAP-type uncharacterized transport system fused permease subunit